MKMKTRIVVDTNVLVSFVLRPRSVPGFAVGHVVRFCQPVFSSATREEVGEVLGRPKFDRYSPIADRRDALERLDRIAAFVEITERIRACADPHDDKFLEAAISGGAKAIVSGDRHLLALHPFRSVAILSPADYLRHAGGLN
jgi:putative PIN family toxin of toxin-antitoxin system